MTDSLTNWPASLGTFFILRRGFRSKPARRVKVHFSLSCGFIDVKAESAADHLKEDA
jgi:hypothetical protein